jgi:hypothetical protein
MAALDEQMLQARLEPSRPKAAPDNRPSRAYRQRISVHDNSLSNGKPQYAAPAHPISGREVTAGRASEQQKPLSINGRAQPSLEA